MSNSSPEGRMIVAMSGALAANPTLAALYGTPLHSFRKVDPADASLLVGWGFRPSGRRALEAGTKHSKPVALLEDGFVRSVDRKGALLGINIDDTGIYYDSRSDSRLFRLIRQPLDEQGARRAREIARLWVELGVSKYNDAPDYDGPLPERYALVIDQVRDDLSISSGLANSASFDAMLDAALASDPIRDVVVKIHPDSVSDPSKRHFDIRALAENPRIHVLANASHVASLVAGAEAVFAVTSQVGFEALLHGKPVHTFGMPFYAGWGLTQDWLTQPSTRCTVSLEQLVHAALVDYPRYWNPVKGEESEVEDVLRLVGLNRRLRQELPPVVYALGFSRWKRPFMTEFLSGSEVRFAKRPDDIPDGATLLLWGRRAVPEGCSPDQLLRIEDGFLRSSGLGANLVRPLSLVIDDYGIYYDPTRPSRMEQLLQTASIDEHQLRRAKALRLAIVQARLNKYNLGGGAWRRPSGAQEVVLVVGQVEDDASIAFGASEVRTNEALLHAARLEHPDAYIVYKPHPDVLAGLRRAGSDAQSMTLPYDELITDVDPTRLLEEVDRVHTITSLMGFEALLRKVPVTCHGMPFYAGWGLTDDRQKCDRRTRSLSLDELVHGALIEYPRYWSPRGGLFASPNDILAELGDLAAQGPAQRSLGRRIVYWVVTRWVKLRRR